MEFFCKDLKLEFFYSLTVWEEWKTLKRLIPIIDPSLFRKACERYEKFKWFFMHLWHCTKRELKFWNSALSMDDPEENRNFQLRYVFLPEEVTLSWVLFKIPLQTDSFVVSSDGFDYDDKIFYFYCQSNPKGGDYCFLRIPKNRRGLCIIIKRKLSKECPNPFLKLKTFFRILKTKQN